ncbi:MAG: hypothetical protein IPL72_08070 [Sulfuritalea sp.]|nr:hypothetical protein [Sulfuritalea sp.]
MPNYFLRSIHTPCHQPKAVGLQTSPNPSQPKGRAAQAPAAITRATRAENRGKSDQVFSEFGLKGQARELAGQIGITHPLLYHYSQQASTD